MKFFEDIKNGYDNSESGKWANSTNDCIRNSVEKTYDNAKDNVTTFLDSIFNW